MSSLYDYLLECIENNILPDLELVLLKSEKYLNQTANEFPDYMKEDLIQEARIKIFEKFYMIVDNWNSLKDHKRKLEHYVRTLIRNAMKNCMTKENFMVSIDYSIPNNYTIIYPNNSILDYNNPNIAFSTAIAYSKRQMSNGFLISPNVLKQLLPNPKLTNTIIQYSILDIKYNLLNITLPYPTNKLKKGGNII